MAGASLTLASLYFAGAVVSDRALIGRVSPIFTGLLAIALLKYDTLALMITRRKQQSTNVATIKSELVYSYLADAMVDSYSEEWRHECECAAILAMPSREARNRYVDGVRDMQGMKTIQKGVAGRRGRAHADKLRRDTERLYYLRKAKQPPQGETA